MADHKRTVLVDIRGRPVLSYLAASRNGIDMAREVEVLGPGAAEAVLTQLGGFLVIAPVELATRLLELGAEFKRHAHGMVRDLVADPPPAAWADALPGGGLRIVPCDRAAEDLYPTWRKAYTPGHLDYSEQHGIEPLRRLLAGEALGPVLPCSALVVDAEHHVVACVVVTANTSRPWIAEVFRDPAPRLAGLGGLLLRHVVCSATADGLTSIGLAVTEGNPARRVYEQLGFQPAGSSITVQMP